MEYVLVLEIRQLEQVNGAMSITPQLGVVFVAIIGIVVDFPKVLLTLEFNAPKVMLTIGVVILIEIIEALDHLDERFSVFDRHHFHHWSYANLAKTKVILTKAIVQFGDGHLGSLSHGISPETIIWRGLSTPCSGGYWWL
jgi:hypothetical protein